MQNVVDVIRVKDGAGGYIVINADTFDPEVHQEYDGDPEKPKTKAKAKAKATSET